MAGLERSWAKMLAVAVLLVGAGAAGFAQSAPGASTGSLSGRLTDLYSKPLEGVPVVARNQATGAEARAITSKNGVYRFDGLEPGEYSVQAASPQLGRGRVEDIVVSAGYEARVQTAMKLETPSPGLFPAVLPSVPRPILQQVTPPVNEAALALEALETMPAIERRVRAETLPTTAIELDATLEAEPLQSVVLPGQSWENCTRHAFAGGPVQIVQRPAGPERSASQMGRPAESARFVAQAAGGAEPTKPGESAVPAAQTAAALPGPASLRKSGPAVPAESSTMSATELQALPVSGRRWQDFVLDNTATSTAPAGGQGEILLRGAGQPVNIAVDGVGRTLAFGPASGISETGQGVLGQDGTGPAGMARVGAGGHGLAVSEAAIREVETAAGNVEAAEARAAGGRMNVETQSGTNELHGQGFLFSRDNALGARNPFTQWIKETTAATGATVPVFTAESYTPPDRETTWGIGAGSRIHRNRLFWFAALDSYDRNDPGVATAKHPDMLFAQPSDEQMKVLCARMGLIASGQTEACSNAISQGLGVYSTMLESLAGLLGPAPRTASQWTGFARLDWQASERHRFTLEGIGARWNSPGGGLPRVSQTYGNHSFGSSKASEEWLLGRWENFLTPNLLAVTQASAGRDLQEARPETPSAFEQAFLAGNAYGQLPQIVVDSRYGFTIGNPSRFGQGSYPDEHLYQGRESLDWVRGNLLVKAGFDVSHNADATSLLRNQTGTYSYENAVNFTSDTWDFEHGVGELDINNQHNCDAAGTGFGNLPCYSYYSQTMGPGGWRLSTNDWAGYATAQWEPNKRMVLSAGLRWEREQSPPPFASLSNPELPLTEKMPGLGNQWGPRLGLAVGTGEGHWPLLRLGYGMYFGRTGNSTLETALTQTGSFNGDLNFFMRPTDNLNGGGAPPFPYVLQGEPESVVKPGAVEFAPNFHNPEIHQAVAAVEETLPGRVEVTASAMMSLGRRLPVSIDTNFDSAAKGTITYAVVDTTGDGPLKTAQITVPFYASWPTSTGMAGRLNPDYQQITQIMSRANSTYEAAMIKAVRYSRRGLSLRAHYVYAHAMDWNPNESAQAAGNDVLEPDDFKLEYGTSNLDMRHSAGAMVVYEAPWKLQGTAGKLGNGWMISGAGQARGGLPYTMRVSETLPKCVISAGLTPCTTSEQDVNATPGAAIAGLGPGMNGSGGDNRVYGVGRNTYRYPSTWKIDLRLGRRFDLGHMRQLELLAESFNLFNHQNVTELETTGYYIESGSTYPTLNFLTGLKANTTAFGQPLNVNATNFYRERQIQFGMRLRF